MVRGNVQFLELEKTTLREARMIVEYDPKSKNQHAL